MHRTHVRGSGLEATRRVALAIAAVVAVAGGIPRVAAGANVQATGVAAVQPRAIDPRWVPWLGCWELVTDGAAVDLASRAESPAERTMVCVGPGDSPDGVVLDTLVGYVRVLQQTIVADGRPRAITDSECAGTERAEWSGNGTRLFVRADVTCADGQPLAISTFALLADGPTWIDIQVVAPKDAERLRVRRYRRLTDSGASGWPLSAHAPRGVTGTPHPLVRPLTIEEIVEAVSRVSPRAVEAAMVETAAVFPLDSRRLVELDDAGVPDAVIDLMVALSFPRHFAVERRSAAAAPFAMPAGMPVWVGPWVLWMLDDDDFWWYYATPFGHTYWSSWYDTGGFVDTSPVPPVPQEHGRVVAGLGYTRVYPIEGGGSGGYGGAGTAGGGDQGSATSQGYSSGGGATDTGRTAVPR